MLTRLYIDNYKCFSNFEYRPPKSQLLLGLNGTGKSSVFEVLRLVRALVVEGKSVEELAGPDSLTRWDTRDLQSLEIEVAGNGGEYRYQVSFSHRRDRSMCRVLDETLDCRVGPEGDWRHLLTRHLDEGHLYRDTPGAGPQVVMDWTRSGLFAVQARHDNTRLTWFKERIGRILCLQLDPKAMKTTSDREETAPDSGLTNFASWYRHLSQEYPALQSPLFEKLAEALGNGFQSLKLEREGGDVRGLSAGFRPMGAETTWYRFNELSDGQRMLIALYTLVTYFREYGSGDSGGITLCLDEPDNYVALQELQPFIREILDVVDETDTQALFISHHPEFINYFAPAAAVWLDRPNGAHVRVRPFAYSGDEPLTAAELVARGWLENER
jgi:predicted ATPase